MAVEYFPALQSVQLDPVDGLYVPALHRKQKLPSDPLYPAMHLQFVLAVLPSGEVENSSQSLQLSRPNSSAYLPAGQLLHACEPLESLYLPLLHGVQEFGAPVMPIPHGG